MAGTDWSPKSTTPTDWGGGATKPTDFAGVGSNPKDWIKNSLDILQAAVTATYDAATITYDMVTMYYDGYNPTASTVMDLHPTDYAGVANKPTDWQEVT